jgi:hypothetical protein
MAKPNQSAELRAEQKADFVKYFEDVPVQKYAAMFVGITEQTAIDWMKKDSQFLNDVNQARAKWVKKKTYKAKAEFALERLEHEVFKQRMDVTSDDKAMPSPFSALTVEELRKLLDK